jgi:hypothetical protein
MIPFFEGQLERSAEGVYKSAAIAPYIDDITSTATVEGTASCSIHPFLLEEGVVRDSYGDSESITNIPIYIVVISKAAGGHASLIIFHGGRMFSLGLGYSGGAKMQARAELFEAAKRKAERIKEGAAALLDKVTPDLSKFISDAFLYSPDFLIKPNAVTSSGNPYTFNIADIGILKQKHLERIQTILNAGKQGGGWFSGQATWKAMFQVESLGGTNFKFDSFLIDIKTPYSMLSTRFSSKSAINCTSFLEHIFSERLACPAYQTFISEPGSCYSKGFKDPGKWVKEFARKYQRGEEIGKELNTKFSWDQGMGNWIGTCTVDYCFRDRRWGGKQKTRKGKKRSTTRRHRKH